MTDSALGEELLTAAEVARQFRVSPGTPSRWRKSGALPGIKVGRTIRFRRSDVEELLNPAKSAEVAS